MSLLRVLAAELRAVWEEARFRLSGPGKAASETKALERLAAIAEEERRVLAEMLSIWRRAEERDLEQCRINADRLAELRALENRRDTMSEELLAEWRAQRLGRLSQALDARRTSTEEGQ